MALPSGGDPSRVTSIPYTGVGGRARQVTWGALLVPTSLQLFLTVRYGFQRVRGFRSSIYVITETNLIPAGQDFSVGGSLVVDLQAGDLFEFFGDVNASGAVLLRAGGLTVIVD
ncbi:MAG: hypothetical protein ACREU0_01725 [Burkholderiales bacterium]